MMPFTTARGLLCAALSLLSVGAHAATINVTNTRDTGTGSLRSALTFASKHPNTTIGFRIPAGSLRGGVALIQPLSALPSLTANGTHIDGATQTRFTGNTNAGGPEVMLNGERLKEEAAGLEVVAAKCRLQNLIVSGFDVGVVVGSPRAIDDSVSGCYIGTDAKGTKPSPNGYGLVITGGARNTVIGGLNRADRNVVSGNFGLGIKLSQCQGVHVQGCFVGLDAHGQAKLPNGVNGVQLSDNAKNNLIGGPQKGARNLLSGNGQGGCVFFGDTVSGNRVQGNYVGLDVSGTHPLGNGNAGIELNAAHDNLLGGTEAGAGNVVAGNPNGIRLYAASKNRVQGNYVGLDASGEVAVPNTRYGMTIDTKAHDNLIGGVEPNARNVVSGNSATGVGISLGAYNNQVQGNFIGLNAAGGLVVANGQDGVLLDNDAHDNVIGGTDEGADNVIAGNKGTGVSLSSGVYNNRVQGNFIGTTTAGGAPLFNAHYAVLLCQGAHDNLVGGPQKGARNTLAAGSPIVFFTDKGTTKNRVEANYIGVDATGTHVLLEGWAGVQFSDGATGNSLGGSDKDAGNLIGVTTEGKDQYIGNSIEGNLIQNNTPFSQPVIAPEAGGE